MPLLVSKVVALDGIGLVGVALGPVLLLDRPQLGAPLPLDLAVVALRGQVVRMLQPGKTCIALLLVPWALSFVPAYMVYTQFGMVDTYWALIVPRIVNGSIFGIFLLRAFFAGLPEEIFEAARIDGAGSFALIWHITIPMSTGILATLAVLDFIGAWNDFLWPFVAISSKSKRVISVGLYLLQADTAGVGLGPAFSGYTIASIPLAILFFALGKYYVEGLVESGLKA